MRKIRHISLVLTLAPILFTGCTQDKVSRVAPSKSVNSYRQSSLSVTEKSLKKKQPIDENELDKLVALVQSKLAEEKRPKIDLKVKPTKLSLVKQLPLVDPSSIEEIDDAIEEIDDAPSPTIANIATDENYQSFNSTDVEDVDTQDDDLAKLTRLVSNNLDTDINGINGVYSTPIVIDVEEDKKDKIVKMLEEIKTNKISREKEIINTAIAYLDTKYVWAANGPTSFDCSGFTKYVFGENGLTLPRYSGNQAKVGIKVSFNELEVGDLVFFDTETSHKKRKVNHVGIYIGNNKFIHASSAKKKVTITSFKKKKFYEKRFLWGRRVIHDDSTYASL